MGLLVFLFFTILPFSAQAAAGDSPAIEVIFDAGNSDASVGVIGEEILEVGTFYEGYRVVSFELEAIILKDEAAEDFLKWLKEGSISDKARLRARRLFVVKQLRAIDEAQHLYLEKFQNHFAPDINTLIDQGFLPDGFQETQKQSYHFKIMNAGEGKQLAVMSKKPPIFFAAAEPKDVEQDPWFFGVDQLGQVRYAKSMRAVPWGPVWEYNGLNEEPPSTVITYEDEK